MHPNLRRRIGGRSARCLAFGAASARAVTRSMGRSRPSQRCARQLTNACELSMQRYRSNGSSARLEASGGSTVGEVASGLLSPQKTRVRVGSNAACNDWKEAPNQAASALNIVQLSKRLDRGH